MENIHMSSNLLLPHAFKKTGWYLFIPFLVIGVIITITGYEADWLNANVFAFFNHDIFEEVQSFQFIKINITNTLVGVLFIVGALLVAFSKEKVEDEFIAKMRLSAFMWAVLMSYILLLLAFILVYGSAFLTVMVYNMFTVLIIFILKFNWTLYRNTKNYEK